jgi:hypothetical protein
VFASVFFGAENNVLTAAAAVAPADDSDKNVLVCSLNVDNSATHLKIAVQRDCVGVGIGVGVGVGGGVGVGEVGNMYAYAAAINTYTIVADVFFDALPPPGEQQVIFQVCARVCFVWRACISALVNV